MVSFHTPLSPNRRKIAPRLENLLKKRKFGDDLDDDRLHNQFYDGVDDNQADQNPISEARKTMMEMMSTMKSSKLNTELHLETRIPQEWQRCLDIKSGQIYFYNTRTKQRKLNDPRSSPEPPPTPPGNGNMSLDLELNLPCGSSSAKNQVVEENTITNPPINSSNRLEIMINSTAAGIKHNIKALSRAPSWLTLEETDQEMVAAACRKCHMLVMMSKSSPSCPNCKFLHPPELSSLPPPSLLKRRLSLLC